MSEQTHEAPKKATEPFLLVILAALFSLTVKSAFERTFSKLEIDYTLNDFAKVDWGENFLVLFQLLVFLITLVRFYLGAYYYARETHVTRPVFEIVVDYAGALLLFTGFYITSISVRATYFFYIY